MGRRNARHRRHPHLRANRRWSWFEFPDIPGGYYRLDWQRLRARYGHRCARCGRGERKLFRCRLVPPPRGGTNNIGNLIPLCWECKSFKHGKTWMELRMRDIRVARAAEVVPEELKHRSHAHLAHRRFVALAQERGFLRPGTMTAYQATDPDACTCTRGQAPHLTGSPVCRQREAS